MADCTLGVWASQDLGFVGLVDYAENVSLVVCLRNVLYEQSHCGVLLTAAMLTSILSPACSKCFQDVKQRCMLHIITAAHTAANSFST